eukprot:gnl/TRDRNA2_/TRDRNA2_39124_c0_seq1.p1 gnl/TRDRNA2_/TRDRNA2_39124_c0~~gnl/TRDRNA2_/TRDRNA2_39124_c0_seq1.p1  ORF type:complete len:567 (-),score=71.20 gnl/TRDRNA2_/TRDRNA2_39124_c0_seq1:187-1758(-)
MAPVGQKIDTFSSDAPPRSRFIKPREFFRQREIGVAQLKTQGVYELPALPFAYDALEPFIDEATMRLHHDKHHATYVANLNAALETAVKNPLLDVVKGAMNAGAPVRNSAGGTWNHNFFWQEMAPKGKGGVPSEELSSAVKKSFGSFETFQAEFKSAAFKRFGSGWAWLVVADGSLFITSTPNQDNPLMKGVGAKEGIPILGLDVWEHAYYLKYKNLRASYIDAWWNVVNWNQVNLWFAEALSGTEPNVVGSPATKFLQLQHRVGYGSGQGSDITSLDDRAPYQLPSLPYAYNALEPYIDKETMMLHHDKHHATYIANLNKALSSQKAVKSLPELFESSSMSDDLIRNNGGGVYNHQLFWQEMAPKGTGGEPSAKLHAALDSSFGSFIQFQKAFNASALKQFGSGWVWLVVGKDDKHLSIVSTANQDNPLMKISTGKKGIPILGLDVWEHAYYLKYHNVRASYVDAWWHVVNWNKVNEWYNTAIEGSSQSFSDALLTSSTTGAGLQMSVMCIVLVLCAVNSIE